MADTPDLEPVQLACGWSCPPGYAPIVCENCNHLFGDLRPVRKGSPEAKPESCGFCIGADHKLLHVRLDKAAPVKSRPKRAPKKKARRR
jgi:hypothetical protein